MCRRADDKRFILYRRNASAYAVGSVYSELSRQLAASAVNIKKRWGNRLRNVSMSLWTTVQPPLKYCSLYVSLFDDSYPALRTFDFALLNAGDCIIEFLENRTHLVHAARELD